MVLQWQRQPQYRTHEASNDAFPMLGIRYDNENTAIKEPYDMLAPDSRGAKSIERRQNHTKRWSKWRVAALNFAIAAVIVFSINSGITAWVFSRRKTTQDVFSEGDCGRIKRLNSVFHAIINVLSTILLSGSNYCMQCLSAPTRRAVDVAHAKNRKLDIGIPSFRNLASISRRRLVLWCLLGFSSLPLHLLYNSAVYASLSSNDYRLFMVSEAFLEGTQCRNCSSIPETPGFVLEDLWTKSHDNTLDRLEPAQCIEQYATSIQTERRNLLLVASNRHFNQSKQYPLFGYPDRNDESTTMNVYWMARFQASDAEHAKYAVDSYDWICSATPRSGKSGPYCSTTVETIKKSPTSWHVGDKYTGDKWPVEYCLSEKATAHCKLHFNFIIAIVVIGFNFLKAILMFFTVFSVTEEPLMTMGDAIASFLEVEDLRTRDMCLATTKDAKLASEPVPTVWKDARFRWRDTTSRARSFMNLSWLTIAILAISGLLAFAIRKTGLDAATIVRLGFGAVDARTVINYEKGEFPKNAALLTLIANLPQVVLSLIYFAYNAAFTAMLMGREWMAYSRSRKGLRVSRRPVRDQRSTYFLQLPYRFGIPLVLLSGVLHWLVSQSIFLVSIEMYDAYGSPCDGSCHIEDLRSCGYSPIAMIAVIIFGCIMVVAVIGFGFVPYQRGMPLAGSSSIAISAACHPGEECGPEGNALSESKLQWGVVSTSADGVGHCAFSSKKVDTLVKGQRYA